MKIRKLFALLMAAVMLLGMLPVAHAELTGCNHDWDSGKWINGVPANCNDWKTKRYTCTICGATNDFREVGPCVPGSKTWVRPQGSNCQEYGVWEITCRHCGEQLESGEEPGPHKWRETIVEEPWCDVGGMKAMICSVCGEWQNNGTPLNPLGHNWGSWRWAHGSAPSCTEGAWQVRECKRCGRMEDRYVEAGSHKYGEWITTVEPTCTERGRHHHRCTVCGASTWEYMPTVDHVYGDWRVIEEPQVGIPGTERRSCIYNCGTHEDREIPALEETLELPGLALTLTLDSTPANGEYFVVGEQVVFTAYWSNLSPFELFPFYVSIWPYEQPSRDSQDLPYSCSFDAEEPITPGMTGSHSMVITVTEEDVARGGIYAMAYIWSSVHNGPEVEEVTTPFVTAPCAPVAGSDYATSIKLEIFDVPSVTAEWAGDVYPVKVKVTNTGDTTVDLCDFAFVDANGNTYLNAILYDWNKYAIDPPCDWLPAGASLTTDLEFAVTQDGIAAGELRFNLVQYASPWYAQVGDQYTDTPADIVPAPEGTTGYYSKTDAVVSDTVEIVVPINQGEDESAAEGLTVTKTASAGSYSDPCKPGDKVIFTITVTNNTGEVLTDVEITDPVKGGNEDAIVDIIPSMQPGESVTASFSYTVTEEDATVGVEGFENTAYASGYTADGTQVSGTSETIFVWCVIEHGLTFFKSIANVPANGVFFVPGETIVFNISMFNHTPYPLYNIILTDPLCQDQYIYDAVNDMSYLYFGELYHEGNAMGESTSATVTVSYVVTEADAEAGSVTNTAEVWYQTWYGKEITDSASATAPCAPTAVGNSTGVRLEKELRNAPANGEYYVPGEVLNYALTLRIDDGLLLDDAAIYDPINGGDGLVISYGKGLYGSMGMDVFYTVTEEDAQRGYVENTAYATWVYQDSGEAGRCESETVIALCGMGELPEDYEPPVDDDIDGDGIPNGEDPDIDGDGTPNGDDDDIDGDGIPNEEDPDADGDGIPNDEDSEPFGPADTQPIAVVKGVGNAPADPEGFMLGEVIEFTISVTNNLPETVSHISLVDPLIPDWSYDIYALEPGATASTTVSYTVNILDCFSGSVENYVSGRAVVSDGYRFVKSNTVSAACREVTILDVHPADGPFGVITGLEVTKEVESLPLNGLYYTEGETVAYRITYVNSGETPLTDVMIYDTLAGMTEIASAETLDVGESRFCVFNYTVTAADVARGYVSNTAVGQFEIDGYQNMITSETVIVDTDGQTETEIPEGGTSAGSVDLETLHSNPAYCLHSSSERTNATYFYSTSFCINHEGTQGSILLMEKAAVTPEMQLQTANYAVALWRGEVEKLYETLLDAADPQARAIIMTEYVSFLTHAANYEAMLNARYADQPAMVTQLMANLWEEKCITLCFDMHSSADARRDSLLAVPIATMDNYAEACTCVTRNEDKGWNGMGQTFCPTHAFPFAMIDMLLGGQDTAEAWTTVRQIWNVELRSAYNKVIALLGENSDVALAEYATLESWMIAREAELTLLYPDNPELVAQTMVRIVIDQVNALCQLAQ